MKHFLDQTNYLVSFISRREEEKRNIMKLIFFYIFLSAMENKCLMFLKNKTTSSKFFSFSSLSELLGDLLNIATSTPVSTTTVVGRDLFFGEWMDEVNVAGEEGGAGVQSVIITVPFRSISLNGCALAAQRNSGIVVRIHSTVTTTNHLEVVAGDVRSFRTHTMILTFHYRTSSHYHLHSFFRIQSSPSCTFNC